MTDEKFNPPQNDTPNWRVVVRPDTSEEHAEIAGAFWEFTIVDGDVKFTHKTKDLSELLGISQNKMREIQLQSCVLQPPLNHKLCCTDGCDMYLNWVKCSSRTKFLEFLKQDYYCRTCLDKRLAAFEAEQVKLRAERARLQAEYQQNRIAKQAAHKEQLRQRYGERIVGDCPQCDGVKIIRKNKNGGGMFVGCSAFPRCDYRSSLPNAAPITDADMQEFAEAKRLLALAPKCPTCSAAMIRRNGKFGAFYGCSNYPRCRMILAIPAEPVADVADVPIEAKYIN